MRRLGVLWLVGLLAAIVAGCGGSGGGGSSDGGGVRGTGKLSGTITFETLQLKPDLTDYVNGLIGDFERQHPGVKVKWQDIPFEGAQEKVIADAGAGALPDVMNLNPGFSYPLAKKGLFMNMDEAAADVKASYVPGAYAAFDMPGVGHSVGLPWYLAQDITAYNASIFRKAGLTKPPTTLPEYFADARRIKAKTGVYGFHPALENRFIPDLVKLGVPITNAEGTRATFDTPAALGYVQQLVSLYRDKVLPPDSVSQGHRDEIQYYAGGQVAMFPGGQNFLPQIKQNAPDVYRATALGPQVAGKGGKVGLAVMGILVPKATKRPDTAVAFAKFVTNAANQMALAKLQPIFPSVTRTLGDPYFTHPKGNTPEAQARRISASQIAKGTADRPPMDDANFDDAVVAKIQAAMLGKLTPQQALQQAQDAATRVLQGQ
jgi:multiple sugar transport system substrate-binding protein